MYDHFIGVDWAQNNMAIARMTKCAKTASVIDVPADIKELQLYQNSIRLLGGEYGFFALPHQDFGPKWRYKQMLLA